MFLDSDEAITDEEMAQWSQLDPQEMVIHAMHFINAYLGPDQEDISEDALIGLYIAGFCVGRMWEEQRE